MSNPVDIFVYEGFDEAKPVRVVMRDDKPWFVAKDVCAIMNVKQPTRAIEPLDDDEKGVSLTPTRGGDQNLLIISESGLYTLILRSNEAITKGSPAHKFRRWVTGELLPQIRKEGTFGTNDPTAEWDWDIIREKIHLVREMRLSAGKKAAAHLWRELALPMPSDEKQNIKQPSQGVDFVQQFLSDCTEESEGSRVQASILFDAYRAWAERTDSPTMTQSAFGRTMNVLGFDKHRGRIYTYLGIRIRHESEVCG